MFNFISYHNKLSNINYYFTKINIYHTEKNSQDILNNIKLKYYSQLILKVYCYLLFFL